MIIQPSFNKGPLYITGWALPDLWYFLWIKMKNTISFFTPFLPMSFVGYGISDCPSLDACKTLAGCGCNCKLILVMQHLKVFSLTLLQMHSLSAPCDLLEAGVWKLGQQLRLPTGSWLFSRQVPWPLLQSQSSWLTSHKTQSLHEKDTTRPQSDSETWFWVPSYKVEEMGSAAFRQKRGLNPARHTPWERTLNSGYKKSIHSGWW